MKENSIQHLLERIAGLLRTESRACLVEHGLQPVQFDALRYLSICNRYSDTPMAVTEYLGQTKGTISQTLKVLEKKGLVDKVSDLNDKRVTHLKLTENGFDLLEEFFPSSLMEKALRQLPHSGKSDLEKQLLHLLTLIQKENQLSTFGQCRTCVHNKKLNNSEHLCGLTGETLSLDEVTLICREHQSD